MHSRKAQYIHKGRHTHTCMVMYPHLHICIQEDRDTHLDRHRTKKHTYACILHALTHAHAHLHTYGFGGEGVGKARVVWSFWLLQQGTHLNGNLCLTPLCPVIFVMMARTSGEGHNVCRDNARGVH